MDGPEKDEVETNVIFRLRPYSLLFIAFMLILRLSVPHIRLSGVAKRIKHSNVTSATKLSLAKEHLAKKKEKNKKQKKKKKTKRNKQITATRCGKSFISCINICLSKLYYGRVRGQPVRVQILPLTGHRIYGN